MPNWSGGMRTAKGWSDPSIDTSFPSAIGSLPSIPTFITPQPSSASRTQRAISLSIADPDPQAPKATSIASAIC